MTTYTVTDRHGEIIDRHLSLRDAAHAVMTCDGHDYDVRPELDGDGFSLWTTQFSRNSTLGGRPMLRTDIRSIETDAEKAQSDIMRDVITHSRWWCGCSVMTDEAYGAMQAEAEAEA